MEPASQKDVRDRHRLSSLQTPYPPHRMIQTEVTIKKSDRRSQSTQGRGNGATYLTLLPSRLEPFTGRQRLPACAGQIQPDPFVRSRDRLLTVRLQADCFAGVWGHAARASLAIDDRDLKDAVNAAHAIDERTRGIRWSALVEVCRCGDAGEAPRPQLLPRPRRHQHHASRIDPTRYCPGPTRPTCLRTSFRATRR